MYHALFVAQELSFPTVVDLSDQIWIFRVISAKRKVGVVTYLKEK